jgi:hypothetical protein
MTIGVATSIREALGTALAMPVGDKVVLVINMNDDFQITKQE